MTSGLEPEGRPGPTAAQGLVEHFFRREYGRLVALLTRKAGVQHIELVAGSYLWDAVLGDLHRRAGNLEIAQRHRERALASAPTQAVRDLLRRRLAIPA